MERLSVGLVLLLLQVNVFAKEQNKPAFELCELNADINGYLMVMSQECGYEVNKNKMKQFAEINKRCIAEYSSNTMFNITMKGIHSAKKDLAEHERGDVCTGIYESYKEFF